MKPSCRFLPLVPAAALAACGSPATTASVQLDPHDGWAGTAEVLVHKPDGTMASRTPITTSLDVAVDDGDTLTVVLHDAGQTALMSAVGIARGDLLELNIGPLGSAQTTQATVNLPTVADATSWQVSTPSSTAGSNSSGGSLSIDLPAGTKSVPIIGAAFGASGVLAMYGEKDAPVDASGNITLTDTVAYQTVTLNPQNAPAGGLGTFAAGNLYLGDQALSIPGQGDALAAPTGFGDELDLVALAFGQTEFDLAGGTYGSVPSGPVNIDLSMPDLPQISAVALANGTASWTLTGGGSYNAVGLDLGSTTDTNFSWSLVGPSGTASLVLPQLPTDLAAPAFDQVSVTAVLRSDLDGFGGTLHATSAPTPGSHMEERTVSLPSSTSAAPRVRGKREMFGAHLHVL